MAIPEQFLEELVSRNDIVDVVSGYVTLTKRSGANLFGLCPFHGEKTPSFSVSRDKQIYHCFGCGKGGGVVNFIMEMEHLSFPDAVEFLAKRSGLQVPEDKYRDDGKKKERERLLQLNREAARWFHANLRQPCGETAVAYIRKRQISAEMVTRFGLGAAPDSWNALTDEFRRKGYTPAELVSAGLAKQGSKGIYDAFRNRLIFPVIDVRGNVLGFSGRILGDGEPKYYNSPETAVFIKSRNLFGMNLAKKTKAGMLLLVEGNVDVVSLHQAGFDFAVASLGTSLTEEQARLMSRYVGKVVIGYDSDAAGIKATQRAISLLEGAGLEVKVLSMTGAKDPDEYIKANGADAFYSLLKGSEGQMDYRLRVLAAGFQLEEDEGKIGYLNGATGLLSELPNAVEREVYARRVAEETGISLEAVEQEIRKKIRQAAKAEREKRERSEYDPAEAVLPKQKEIRYASAALAASEMGLIRVLYREPTLFESSFTPEEVFSSELLRRFCLEMRQRYRGGERIEISLMGEGYSSEEMSHLVSIVSGPEKCANAEEAFRDYLEKIRLEKLKQGGREKLAELTETYRQKKGYGG